MLIHLSYKKGEYTLIKLSISSSNTLTYLYDFINTSIINEDIKLLKQDKLLKINITDKDNIDVFYTQLAIFIFSTIESKLITKIKDLFGKNEIQSLSLENTIEEDFFTIYINPVKILIKEHFKYSKSMNIESFITFNCRGLKKELNSRYNDYIVLFNQESNNQHYFNNNTNKNAKEITSSIDNYNDIKTLNLIFEELKPNILSKIDKMLLEDCNVVHARKRSGKIELISSKNNNLIKEIYSLVTPDVLTELENSDIDIKMFTYILFCITILESKQVIFHKSIPDEVTSQILLYLYEISYMNECINKVNFLKCKGCTTC